MGLFNSIKNFVTGSSSTYQGQGSVDFSAFNKELDIATKNLSLFSQQVLLAVQNLVNFNSKLGGNSNNGASASASVIKDKDGSPFGFIKELKNDFKPYISAFNAVSGGIGYLGDAILSGINGSINLINEKRSEYEFDTMPGGVSRFLYRHSGIFHNFDELVNNTGQKWDKDRWDANVNANYFVQQAQMNRSPLNEFDAQTRIDRRRFKTELIEAKDKDDDPLFNDDEVKTRLGGFDSRREQLRSVLEKDVNFSQNQQLWGMEYGARKNFISAYNVDPMEKLKAEHALEVSKYNNESSTIEREAFKKGYIEFDEDGNRLPSQYYNDIVNQRKQGLRNLKAAQRTKERQFGFGISQSIDETQTNALESATMYDSERIHLAAGLAKRGVARSVEAGQITNEQANAQFQAISFKQQMSLLHTGRGVGVNSSGEVAAGPQARSEDQLKSLMDSLAPLRETNKALNDLINSIDQLDADIMAGLK